MRFLFFPPQPNSALALTLSFDKHSNVTTSQVQIRRLTPSEGAAYREIRLEALRSNPEAFGSTFEAESIRPLAHFSERVAACPVFAVFRDPELVGMAGFLGREGIKDAHKGMLWGNVRSAERQKYGRRAATGGSGDCLRARASGIAATGRG
jgi:hypothetical protein